MNRALATALATALVAMAACGRGKPAGTRWSPDGADLVYTSNTAGNPDIWLLPAGGGDPVQLTRHGANDNWPAWSPDGTKIAFQSDRAGELDVYVMNADGSHQVRLTESRQPEYLPSWTPDGVRITFTSWRMMPEDTVRSPHLWTMYADGGNAGPLVTESLGTSAGASWAPDGTLFITTREFGEGIDDLVVYNAEGTKSLRLTHGPGYNGAAEFSPDGRRIAFHCDRGDTSSIEVMNSDGTERRSVVATGKNWYPHWSPDGRWLTYTTAVNGDEKDLDIYAVEVDGGKPPRRLVGGPGLQLEGRWRPNPPPLKP